ncbi:hypothetical protein OCL06_16030 [Alteromonas sp. ASW11-19]|uniref:SNIPE associated domain-containing protein n=1 Tax=Alteromonas salexigens TaxID=2982530 RepID=A0ABT2VS34_9ALTE|nr:hypothetical protein [Alteromonas salexigens]MCU7556101.1 hypothetical protein [Alteromonas salexigens]
MNNTEAYIGIAIVFITIGLLAYGIYIRREYILLKKYITERNAMLENATVESLEESLKMQFAQVTEKIKAGRIMMEKVKARSNEYAKQVRRIEVGLTPPTFRFDHSETLKENVIACREKQYECIKADRTTESDAVFEWFGSRADGQKLVDDYRLLLLKAFNAEFEVIRQQMRGGQSACDDYKDWARSFFPRYSRTPSSFKTSAIKAKLRYLQDLDDAD